MGPKPSEENKREFTEEQLRAGDGIIGLQAGTNKGATQVEKCFEESSYMLKKNLFIGRKQYGRFKENHPGKINSRYQTGLVAKLQISVIFSLVNIFSMHQTGVFEHKHKINQGYNKSSSLKLFLSFLSQSVNLLHIFSTLA